MKYITGVIQNKENKLLAINTMPDHCHIFLGLNPKESISALVKDVKLSSGDFINEKRWLKGRFHWQEGYCAFSYSHSQIDGVVKYIQNQEKHHQRVSFKNEYIKILKSFDVEYEEAYLFKWIEDLKF